MRILFKKVISIFLSLTIFFTSLAPFGWLSSSFVKPIYAANSCGAGSLGDLRRYLSSRVGGVSLDQAAVFLADMSDMTGAYYDADQDRIVFIGQKGNTSLPKFDKDDLAVAIRALVFKNQIPAVSMEYKDPSNIMAHDNLNVLYYGGIEDTRFGQVLVEVDYKMKIYGQGYDENGRQVVSSVPGYKSFLDRYIEKGASLGAVSRSRHWISPKEVVLKKDDSGKSFIFDSVKMQVSEEAVLSTNDPNWNAASKEFVQHLTDYYNLYANEIPSFYESKQLAKIVGIVKWIIDNNIVNNFEWARDYQPKYVYTPREIRRLTAPYKDTGRGFSTTITGGVIFSEANSYKPDDGSALSIKNSSEAVGTPTEEVHWTFTNNGQQYEAVAVEANAFRSIGAYTTTSTDISFPMSGDLTLSFQRNYSSFSGGQKGIGRGWDFIPAQLYDNKTSWYVNCTSGLTGSHLWKLGLTTASGLSETFTFTSCTTGYSSDKPEYHSKVAHNSSDGTLSIKLKDQTEYLFDPTFKLSKVKDKNGNTISYNYDSLGKVTGLNDGRNHQLTLSYNSSGLISAVGDWTGRSVQYSYDSQSNLISVTDPRGQVIQYKYDDNNKLAKIIDRLGQTVLENTYTPEAKIATQKDAGGATVSFIYAEQSKTVTASDTNGRTGKIIYDDKARVTENTDALNSGVKYTYGTEFTPLTITDKKGNKTTFVYDTNGNATAYTLATLKKITYEYDIGNRVTRILDGRYGSTAKDIKFTYDQKGNLTQISESGLLTKYTYDPYGEMLTLTNPLSQKTTWTRNEYGNPLTVVDSLNNTTAFEYDPLARVTKDTDPERKVVSYGYDPNNNILSRIDNAGTISYVYDAENRIQKVVLPNSSVSEYVYNGTSSLVGVKDALSNLTSYGYDAYQNLISQQDTLNRTTTYAYDKLDRQTQETTPLGKVSKWEYDVNGNINKRTNANGSVTIYQYDNLNRLTKTTYPDSTSVSYIYDDRNNLTKVTNPIGSTTFTYDIFDRLTAVTNPYGRKVSYTYDNVDNLTKITYPDNKTSTYSYDLMNRLANVTDWNLSKTTFTYNKNGRLIAKSLPNGVSASYLYDGANRLTNLSYNQSGSILAKFSYVRNALGNVIQATEEGSFFSSMTPTLTPTPTTISVTPTRTPTISPTPTSTIPTLTPTPTVAGSKADLVVTNITLSNPSPKISDRFDITVKIKNQGNASTKASSLRIGLFYDKASAPVAGSSPDDYPVFFNVLAPGQESSVTETYVRFSTVGSHNIWAIVDNNLQENESNETNNVFGPYNVNVLASNSNLNNNFAVIPLQTSLSKIFSWIKVAPAFAQAQPPQFVTNFIYDVLSRLTSASYPDGKQYGYTYDATGNRLSLSTGSGGVNYTYNNDNQLTQEGNISYLFNANGNITSKNLNPGTQSFTYNFENKLTSYSAANGIKSSYQYDGLGNRLEKTVGSITTRFISDISGRLPNVIAETNSFNTIQNWYVYGYDLISQGAASTSNRLYPLADGMGNIRFVTNSGGLQVKRYDYDPYGNIRVATGSNNTNYEFSSQQLDPESGMYYLRARYYDPGTGRFISKDPIKGLQTIPQTQNPYAYALNNPNSNADPSGLWYVDVGVSSGIIGPLGAGVGIQVNSEGATAYVSAGVITPGKGVTVMYSSNDPRENDTTANFAANFIAAGSVSYPYTREPVRFSSGEIEVGLGFPAGASATVNRTFKTFCW